MIDVELGGTQFARAAVSAQHSLTAHRTALTAPLRTITVTTNGPGHRTYAMDLWASDEIADCAAHAPPALTALFAQQPCAHATRYLWTTVFHGQALAVSVVSVRMPPAPDGTGSPAAQKLLRLSAGNPCLTSLPDEIGMLPAFAYDGLPADAVHLAAAEDDTVTTLDAWHIGASATPPTNPHDRALHAFEQQLFLTAATAVHG